MKSVAKILLAVPYWDTIAPETSLWAAMQTQRGDLAYLQVKGRPHDYARNCAVRALLQSDCTHLMMVDSDIIPPEGAIDKLLALDSPIVTGVYRVIGGSSIEWAVLQKDAAGKYRMIKELNKVNPFAVDAAGAGCLLIKREVFETIPWPWFKWVEFADGSQMSEDVFFFDKASAAGITAICDPSVKCDHFKNVKLKGN